MVPNSKVPDNCDSSTVSPTPNSTTSQEERRRIEAIEKLHEQDRRRQDSARQAEIKRMQDRRRQEETKRLQELKRQAEIKRQAENQPISDAVFGSKIAKDAFEA